VTIMGDKLLYFNGLRISHCDNENRPHIGSNYRKYKMSVKRHKPLNDEKKQQLDH